MTENVLEDPTREPTGVATPPIILLDGGAKYGKSFTAYSLSASPSVGRTFVFEVGERQADSYKRLGPYRIVGLDGTWPDFVAKLEWATNQPPIDGRPSVVVIDTISRVWDDLKIWAERRARNSERSRKILRSDPDADIDVTMNYWSSAKSRWGQMLNILARFDGIVVLVARGDDVALVENGQPVRGQSVWRTEAEKNTLGQVTAYVSIREPREPRLISATNLDLDIPRDGLALPRNNTLDHLIFGVLGCVPADTEARSTVGTAPGVPAAQAKGDVIAAFSRAGLGADDAKAAAAKLWADEMGETPKGAEIPYSTVETLLAAALDQVRNPTPPETTTPPVDGDSAPDPARDAQEAGNGPGTTPTDRSEPPTTGEQSGDTQPDNETAGAAAPAPDDGTDQSKYPNGNDPVAAAAAFVAAKGGDPDGPAADPESVADFDYDDDDDDGVDPT